MRERMGYVGRQSPFDFLRDPKSSLAGFAAAPFVGESPLRKEGVRCGTIYF